MSSIYGTETENWMRTGIPSDLLAKIGIVTIIWNTIEFDLQEFIWVAAGWHPKIGALVTTDMGNVSRFQLARNLIHAHYDHERLRIDMLRAIDYFDACRIRRNALVHGMPVYDDSEQLTGRLARFDAKQGSGNLKISHLNVTPEYVNTLIHDLWLCRQTLTDAERKTMRFNRYRENPPADFDKLVFEYADSPLDTALIQRRVDQLRSVLPSQNIPIEQPLSSPE